MESQALSRSFLRGLPALLIAASVLHVVAALSAWGAASHVEIPDSYTTLAGLAFALPALAVSVLVLREVWRKTEGPFGVFSIQIVAGVAALALAIVIEIALAARIANPETYNSLRSSDGTINTTPSGFLFIALFTTAFFGFFIVLVAYLFAQSITPWPRTAFDRKDDEPDGVGELLRGKPRPREYRWRR